ncbi:MAG: hypothetical protein R2801_04600 [Chitinophagales bacterium]
MYWATDTNHLDIIAVGNDITTNPLYYTTTVYGFTYNQGCWSEPSLPLIINVDALSSPPIVDNVTICEGDLANIVIELP